MLAVAVVVDLVVVAGPGLVSMSPALRRRMVKSQDDLLALKSNFMVFLIFLLCVNVSYGSLFISLDVMLKLKLKIVLLVSVLVDLDPRGSILVRR